MSNFLYNNNNYCDVFIAQWQQSHKEGYCHNPILREWESETHTPEIGTWESFGTAKISEFDCKGQNTSHQDVLYIIEKLLKCKCQKWVRMGHLDI